MTDRSVVVRLKGEVTDFVANMKKAEAAAKGLGENVSGVGAKMSANADKMVDTGKKMTVGLSLPLAAVGVAATKLALDFEASFSRMQGLAGVSADEVDGLRASVLSLAGETGKAPQELAEALYFVRSAGIEGQDALDALEMSAKGAAAGLGQTQQVADAVTSAMNGYGSEVLSAAEATDVLVATAREGKAEASQLAPQFGRLIPIAAELGVSFDEVGAGMAFLSRASGDASLSATQLDGVMQKLIKPSQQGAAALADVGLSTQGLRESIQDQGLLSTLEMLRERLGDSGFVKFFDDVQGLQGALQLTGAQADEARGVFDALADSAGATDDAFAAWADTAGFKNQKAFSDLQAALISLGDELVPLMGKVADFASAVLGWFTALDAGSKNMMVSFGIFVAALGPAISIAGRLTTAVKAMGTAYQWAQIQAGLFSVGGLGAMSLAAPAVIAALAAVGTAVHQYGSQVREATSDGKEWAAGFAGQFDPSKATMAELTAEIDRLNGAANQLQEEANNALNPFLDDRLKTARDETRALAAPLEEVVAKAAELQEQLGITADEALDMATNQAVMSEATATATGAIDEEAAAIAQASTELQGYSDALTAMFDPLFGAQDAMLGLSSAQTAAAEAARLHGADSLEAAEANRAMVRAALDNEQAQIRLADAVQSGDVELDDAIATLYRWVDEGAISKQSADQQADAFRGLAGGVESVPDRVGIDIAVSGFSAAMEAASRLRWEYDRIPRKITTTFNGVTVSRPDRTTSNRWGGITAYAAGGITPAHIQQGELVRYAEPETGGEAYIPRLGDRQRSLGILQTAADWYGMDLVASSPGPSLLRAVTAGRLRTVARIPMLCERPTA